MRTFNRALATGMIVAATFGLAVGPAFAQSTSNDKTGSTNQTTTQEKTQNPTAPTQGSTAPGTNAGSNDQNGAAANSPGGANSSGTSDQNMSNTSNDQSTMPGAKPQKKHAMMSRSKVEQVQTALANSGDNVQIDGDWGPKTTAALKDFQKQHNLKATGRLDKETRDALNLNATKTQSDTKTQ